MNASKIDFFPVRDPWFCERAIRGSVSERKGNRSNKRASDWTKKTEHYDVLFSVSPHHTYNVSKRPTYRRQVCVKFAKCVMDSIERGSGFGPSKRISSFVSLRFAVVGSLCSIFCKKLIRNEKIYIEFRCVICDLFPLSFFRRQKSDLNRIYPALSMQMDSSLAHLTIYSQRSREGPGHHELKILDIDICSSSWSLCVPITHSPATHCLPCLKILVRLYFLTDTGMVHCRDLVRWNANILISFSFGTCNLFATCFAHWLRSTLHAK